MHRLTLTPTTSDAVSDVLRHLSASTLPRILSTLSPIRKQMCGCMNLVLAIPPSKGPLGLLPLRHPLIRLLHRRHPPNHPQPLLNPRIAIELELRIRILIDPRIKMRIHGAETARQHALPTTLPQLSLQHVKRPVRLRFVPR